MIFAILICLRFVVAVLLFLTGASAGYLPRVLRGFGVLAGFGPRWSKDPAQDIKSLVVGPVMDSTEFFAGERLGYSCFGVLCWAVDVEPRWVFLFSRVLSKTTGFAAACFEEALRRVRLPHHRRVVQWSDGPRQFRSLEMLGSSVQYFERSDKHAHTDGQAPSKTQTHLR